MRLFDHLPAARASPPSTRPARTPSTPAVRPASVCACGGGCPRCQGAAPSLRQTGGAASARPVVRAGGDDPGPASPDVAHDPGAAPGSLRAARFQGDPILEQVMANLIHLKKGVRGPQTNQAVQKVQRALIDAGFPLTEYGPDGLFGSETERTVKDFQVSRELPPEEQDGIVGPVTLGLLDDHFATGEAPSSLPPPDPALAGLAFTLAADTGQPRYSNPDSVAEERGDAVYLEGPTYSFLAKVHCSGGTAEQTARWDVGHIQDLTDYQPVGTYGDGHTLAFAADFPIRDSARGEQRYPFYYPGNVKPAVAEASVTSAMMDSPSVQFPAQHKGSELQRIDMAFTAIDWVSARQRHTGELRFVHHATWGFTRSLVLDGWRPGGALPDPAASNTEIGQGSGMGETAPSMTEAVYNDSARLVEKAG